jgi:N-acetylmuramoyl-L-alanine amidase CwlA
MTKHKKIAAIGAGLMLGAAFMGGAPVPALAYTSVKEIISTGHGSLDASYLVIHDTDDYGATARNLMDYWASGNTPYVVHYTMDIDGSVVYQAMEEDRKAWQVGYGNSYVVGIELCYATNQEDFDAQWEEATQWAADFLTSHDWGIDRMISHHMASERWGGSDHTDPDGYFETYGKSWSEFVSDVSAKLGSSTDDSDSTSESGDDTVEAPATEYTNGGSGTTLSFDGGTYTCTVDALNIRDSPGGDIVGQYTKGQTVNLDSYCIKLDGYIWGKYTAYSGKVRYVCVGRATGAAASDDYLVKADTTSTSITSDTYSAGTYRFTSATNIRTGAGTEYSRVGTYSTGSTVHIDSVVWVGGRPWGKYTSYSGHTRYVCLSWTEQA